MLCSKQEPLHVRTEGKKAFVRLLGSIEVDELGASGARDVTQFKDHSEFIQSTWPWCSYFEYIWSMIPACFSCKRNLGAPETVVRSGLHAEHNIAHSGFLVLGLTAKRMQNKDPISKRTHNSTVISDRCVRDM